MAGTLGQGLRDSRVKAGIAIVGLYRENECTGRTLLQDTIAGPPKSPDVKLLADWLDQNLPKHATLYQGVATAVVRAPDKTGE